MPFQWNINSTNLAVLLFGLAVFIKQMTPHASAIDFVVQASDGKSEDDVAAAVANNHKIFQYIAYVCCCLAVIAAAIAASPWRGSGSVFTKGGGWVIALFLSGYLINMTGEVFGDKFNDADTAKNLSIANIAFAVCALVVGIAIYVWGDYVHAGHLKKHGLAACVFIAGYILDVVGSFNVSAKQTAAAEAPTSLEAAQGAVDAVEAEQYMDICKLFLYFIALLLIWTRRATVSEPSGEGGDSQEGEGFNYNYY